MNYNNYDNQYSTTSYSAGGGGGGGGFIPGGASQDSPSGNRVGPHERFGMEICLYLISQGYGQDTLRPVTIKQVNEATAMHSEGDYKIDGAQITQVTFVGQIRNISNQTTNVTYKLDDGTGQIEVKVWVDSDANEPQNPKHAQLVENAYARVWGKLKVFGNKKHVGAHVIRPITDYNEISYHLLEATVVHLHYTRGPPTSAAGNANGTSGQQQQGGYGQGATTGMGGAPLPRMSATATKVYNLMYNMPQSNEGLHQQDIAAQLGMEVAEVAKAGDELLTNGVIYTTVDDSTWAILETD